MQTPVVTGLPSQDARTVAGAIYEEWKDRNGHLDPDTLAVLADALEEAGCAEQELLRHLRGEEVCPECMGTGGVNDDSGGNVGRVRHCYQCGGSGWIKLRGPHVRGCWATDLVLGKS